MFPTGILTSLLNAVQYVPVAGSWLMRCWLYPPAKVLQDVDLSVRSQGEMVAFYLSGRVPYVRIWLRVISKSPYTFLQLHHLTFDLWIGQPICRGITFDNFVIRPRGTYDNLLCQVDLNEFQVCEIQKRVETEVLRICQLYLRGTWRTRYGLLDFQKTLEGVPFTVFPAPHAPVTPKEVTG